MMSRIALAAALLVALSPFAAGAHGLDADSHHGAASSGGVPHPPPAKAQTSLAAREAKSRAYFTDLPVVAQDGKERRFFSDVLEGQTVLIYFFYTQCKDACPLINQKLANVQEQLGDRLGKDITLISITTDPDHDTPPVVKKYAALFDAKPGWLFLTGKKKDIRTIMGRLGQTSALANPTDHTTVLLAGNVDEAKWMKLKPTYSEAQIALTLRFLADEYNQKKG